MANGKCLMVSGSVNEYSLAKPLAATIPMVVNITPSILRCTSKFLLFTSVAVIQFNTIVLFNLIAVKLLNTTGNDVGQAITKGIFELVVVPSPNCPKPLEPQAHKLPSVFMAMV